MTEQDFPFIHRDISWLSFNYRVLQEAKDKSVPLLERLKFLAIYSNNLDEFFRVRVASIRNLVRLGKKTKAQLEYDPKQVIKQILQIVNTHQQEFTRIFEEEIIPELRKHDIYLLRRMDLTLEQKEYVEDYFADHMLPYVQPVLLVKHKIRPFLNNAALYLTVLLKDKGRSHAPDEYAIVKIPSDHLPRFIQLPSVDGRHDVIMLDDIVRHSLSAMFPGYDILDTYSIKLTRDAELYIDDEFSGNLVNKIRQSLVKRHVGPASRFIYDREMPKELLEFLQEAFDLTKIDLLVEGRYHNNFDFFKFPDFDKTFLKNQPLPPIPYKTLEKTNKFFSEIRKKDHLIKFPFHSYESVIQFFEQAASDPKVTHIKITQYRVAKKSRIMDALMQAVKAGKQVFVFIEVKARFDEAANLRWGEKLEAAGVRVHYSFPGVKVHCKLGLIVREEDNGPNYYGYLSTGNFHENTAKVYGDIGVFTADKRLTNEMVRLFNYLETVKAPQQPFKHLLVGKFNLRQELESLIDYEIQQAKKGKKAEIFLKMNSLQDQWMIQRLYQASQSGVKVKLIIRGICCIVPQKKGWSENIEAISIVDRFLEHARIFVFHNNGKPKIYGSSADWMVRNLSHRIETAFPIYDKDIAKQIMDVMEMQWIDNVKARILDEAMTNTYKRNEKVELAIQSQEATYYYFKRKEEEQ